MTTPIQFKPEVWTPIPCVKCGDPILGTYYNPVLFDPESSGATCAQCQLNEELQK